MGRFSFLKKHNGAKHASPVHGYACCSGGQESCPCCPAVFCRAALAGNPNVGKSTLFNALTGLHQHVGNWTGKTVACAAGLCRFENTAFELTDLPGTYSLCTNSPEEEVARNAVYSGDFHVILAVCDATSLERSLGLVLQIMALTPHVVLCVNLCDEAKKKGISIDFPKLEALLGIPVIPVSAARGEGLSELLKQASRYAGQIPAPLHSCEAPPEHYVSRAGELARLVTVYHRPEYQKRDFRIDRIVTGPVTGTLLMLLLLFFLFWLSLSGANYPSALLSTFFAWLGDQLLLAAEALHAPVWLSDMLIFGIYRVSTWVIAVMLPPMAIFFPLFTLLEDLGYLPRIAFNLDHHFKKCSACGKQALCMCMGLGCNAAGVTGCRIIHSPRERLIAILTNAFVPCNGRFPTLITLITLFLVGRQNGFFGNLLGALVLTAVIAFSIAMTFAASRLLSATALKGEASSFILEMPPYRKPQIRKVLIRSLLDRTLFVLGRAVVIAVPAGLVIWLAANLRVGDTSLIRFLSGLLDPLGTLMGLDGMILLAFILGFPANEIVLPIILMGYLSAGTLVEAGSMTELHALLISHGWTWTTAVSMILFSVMHWPCSTTCLTIKKETGSMKWTMAAVFLPTCFGMAACILFTAAVRLLGLG